MRAAPALALVVSWIAFLWWGLPERERMLHWDEVDYVQAGRLGLGVNWLDEGGLGPVEFVAFATAKARGEPPELPARYREDTDPLILRHHHPPFLAYIISLVPAGSDDRWLRGLQALGAGLLLLALWMGWRVGGGGRGPGTAALLGWLGFWLNTHLFSALSNHGWITVFLLLGTASLVWAAQVEARRRWLVPGLMLGLAGITLESAAIGFLALGLWLLLRHRAGTPGIGRSSLLLVGTLLATVLLLWPGVVVHASGPKILGLYAYRLWLGSEYAGVATRLPDLVRGQLPILLLAGTALALCFREGRWKEHLGGPGGAFLMTGLLYYAALLPVALHPSYLMPGAALLIVGLGAGIVGEEKRGREGALLWVPLLLSCIAVPFALPPRAQRARIAAEWEDLEAVGRLAREDGIVYADGGHVFRYYLHEAEIVPVTVPHRGGDLTLREEGIYRVIGKEELMGSRVVIRLGRGDFLRAARGELLAGCSSRDLNTLRVFTCPGPEGVNPYRPPASPPGA